MKKITLLFVTLIFIIGCSREQSNTKSTLVDSTDTNAKYFSENYQNPENLYNNSNDVDNYGTINNINELNYKNSNKLNKNMANSTNDGILIGEYKENAYGLGVHSDATGRAFEWQTNDGQKIIIFKVKPNGYGLGVGMDEFGRPVKPILK